MVVSSSEERSSIETSGRSRIVREARALFTTHGFVAVSMQQIADAAAVNKATLYHHFRDKEDLFISVMTEEFARMSAVVEAAVNGEGTLEDRLQRVAARVLADARGDFGRLAAEMRAHVSEEKRATLIERFTAPWDHLRIVLEQAREVGEVREIDAELVARMFFAMLHSQIWWAKAGARRGEPSADIAATIANLLMDGIRAAPGAESDSA